MTRPTVPGALDYERLAKLHRPDDPQEIAVEVRRLASTGLSAADISTALRIDFSQVNEMLRQVQQ